MNRLNVLVLTLLAGLAITFVQFPVNQAVACDESFIIFDSARISPFPGGNYEVYFSLCVGGGYSSDSVDPLGGQTQDFWFEFYAGTLCPGGFPATLNSGQDAQGCTNCRNACATQGSIGPWGQTGHSPFPNCCDATSAFTTSPCPGATSDCVWYSSNDPTCNGGLGAGPCPAYNFFSPFGCATGFPCTLPQFKCPGPPPGALNYYRYTDEWNGSGPQQPYCQQVQLTFCGGFPDSIVIRGLDNDSQGSVFDCHSKGDNNNNTPLPDQVIDLTNLPVTWKYFTGKEVTQAVQLDWATSFEENNSHFLVQHSDDGNEFRTIERVTAANLQQGQSYRFVDENPISGINYYRILQMDFDGASGESKIVAVNFSGSILTQIKSISPIPAIETTTVSLYSKADQQFTMDIFDLQGRKVQTQTVDAFKGGNFYELDVTTWEDGVYYVILHNNNEKLTGKILKQ